jgi:DAK2 domain fusion protein YloV
MAGRAVGVCVLDELDATGVRRWSRDAATSLSEHRREIDRLNVFPVHDSDTGTNLATTLRAAADALDADRADHAGAALRAWARGAVLGACGNSGNILAQLLRGIADAAGSAPVLTATALRDGLRDGAVAARSAVAEPVEGTVLTVAAAAAEGAAAGSADLAGVARAALAAADEALVHTPEQLPVLAEAGVVDAGARGLVLLLESLVRIVGGVAPELSPVEAPHLAAGHTAATGEYEVQFLLDTPPEFGEPDADALRGQLSRVGDSVVVVGTGDGTWSVHVHTRDAGSALETGIAAGRLYRISVSQLDESVAPPKPIAVVAVASDAGLAQLFASEGVFVVAAEHPDVDDIVASTESAGTTAVVLLPNDARLTRTAEAAADRVRALGIRAAVVPTRSPVQGLAAIAVHDPSRRFDDDVIAMAEAAAATRYAEVTVAESRSFTSAGICQAGDVLGLIDGEVVEIGRGVLAVALAVTDRLLGVGAELITVLVGADAQPGVGEVLRRHVRDRSAYTEVTVYDVATEGVPLLIGVE